MNLKMRMTVKNKLIGGFLFEYLAESWLFFVVLVLNLLILLTLASTKVIGDESQIGTGTEISGPE